MFSTFDIMAARYVVLVALVSLSLSMVHSCGVSTHIAIAHEALNSFSDASTGNSYRNLLLKHRDAFLGGNPYPDIMYPSICFGGKYHQVSEDTHWTPFLNATINYIRRKYPKPWDEATEKLVVFTLGFVSHQVADISWHSLGIDQGFLTTMGDQNFFGSFPAAHSAGDIGGDIVADFERDVENFESVKEWYIPVQDLVNIYSDYYGKEMVDSFVITTCSQLLFLAWFAEKYAGRELFPIYAKKSPFLVENFHDYFLGGVHDMAAWTSEIWSDAVYMIEHGLEKCDLPRSPLFIRCNRTLTNKNTNEQDKLKNPGLWYPVDLHGLTLSDAVVKATHRGVSIRPSASLEYRLLKKSKKMESNVKIKKGKISHGLDINRAIYTTTTPHARLGWSSTSGNFSGLHDDLIIGAPNHGYPGKSQFGRLYVMHVDLNSGLPLKNITLDTEADQIINGTVQNGRFGTSLAVVDLNKDGVDDLAVGAPGVGANSLEYKGAVYVFYGNRGSGLHSFPSLTILGANTYDNIGFTLASEDLDQDGFADLLVGCPYAPGGGEQRGMVGIFLSSAEYKKNESISVLKADWLLYGKQNYGWFGFSIAVTRLSKDMTRILVSAPTFRLCALKNCQYSDNDTQSVGQLIVYEFHPSKGPSLSSVVVGKDAFSKFGTSVSVGDPFNTGVKDILAVSSSSADIEGTVGLVSSVFHQAGEVHLFNLSRNPDRIATFESDRHYSRLGSHVGWYDVNLDGIDDLVLSAPYRTDQFLEVTGNVEQGVVYVFFGGESFPLKDATRNCSSSFIEPCPAVKASLVFHPDQDESQFGSWLTAVTVQSNHLINLVISSPRRSEGAFHGGAVHVYSVKRP